MGAGYRKIVAVTAGAFAAASGAALMKAMGAPPNIEGLMPFAMTMGIALGPASGFAGAFIARAIYDVDMAYAGWWTPVTSVCYGIVGMGAALAGMHVKKWGRLQLACLAAALTLLYDAASMLAMGLPFGIPLGALVAGQVPFTIAHLAGNVLLSFAFAPYLLKAFSAYAAEGPAPSGVPLPAPAVHENARRERE
jgi:hypothetical protein